MNRWGLMLVNLGTPDSTDPKDVRRYLDEFLSDPRVLDINPIVRRLLLNLVILRKRPAESAAAYETIWTDRGSPLLFHGLDLIDKIRRLLGDEVEVELAMRYQNPSIADVLARFQQKGVDKLVVFPLFPQYSSAAWGSAVEKVNVEANRLWNVPTIQYVPPFYDHPAFLESWRPIAEPVLNDLRPDRVVMSFHGIPERHCTKSDVSNGSHCFQSENCCDQIVHINRYCYRAQCMASAKGIANVLELEDDQWEVTFQSRLGRDPWIRPYTDERIVELAKQGVKRVAVMCPAFVADCLETVEEIGIRAREDFKAHGGEELQLVPSLNSHDAWAEAAVRIVREASALGRHHVPLR